MGNVLFELKRYEEALAAHTKAISLAPGYAEAHSNMGNVLFELKRYEAAASNFIKALDLKPDFPNLLGRLAFAKLHISDWSQLDDLTKLISEKILLSENVSVPFDLLPLLNDPDLLKKSTISWSSTQYPAGSTYPKIPKPSNKKIRIGYFSSDFYNHATTHLMAEFFELHNKDNFEIIAFSFGPKFEDSSRERIKQAFHQFIDVSEASDESAAVIARNLELDIAIDLKGHTQHARPKLFSYRVAPIQVAYLGYPGTTGAPFIDYLIADHTLIPKESIDFYTEKIIYLPNSYQVNDAKRTISNVVPSRVDVGLPEDGFVFCCFNGNYKITSSIFDSWARILHAVEGSVLWLLNSDSTAKENLIKEIEARGISGNRLIFAGQLKTADHLARHRLADLFIDTSPCNAHTTASDALLSGLPVLTLLGDTFAGRVAASLLSAVGLPELITTNQSEYEAMAIELATNKEKLAILKQRLEANKLSSPLFNTKLTTEHIEAAYTKIYARYQADLMPDHIYIAA